MYRVLYKIQIENNYLQSYSALYILLHMTDNILLTYTETGTFKTSYSNKKYNL